MAHCVATVPFMVLFALSALAVVGGGGAAADDDLSLLQVSVRAPLVQERINPSLPLAHHWPHIRGRPGEYSLTRYPMKLWLGEGSFNESLPSRLRGRRGFQVPDAGQKFPEGSINESPPGGRRRRGLGLEFSEGSIGESLPKGGRRRTLVPDAGLKFSEGGFNESLLWRRRFGNDDILWNSVIDHEGNIYTAGIKSLTKLSPTGELIWTQNTSAFTAILMGNALCTQSNLAGRYVYCVSQRTGEVFWERMAYPTAGIGGNMLEGNRGVLLVAGGEFFVEGLTNLTGNANDRVIALNATNGNELWQFKVSCGLWQLMGLFPDNDTTLFQDQCGGMYRLGLFNGSLIWYTPGEAGILSDGSAILGPDGSAYGCSMSRGSVLQDNVDAHKPGVISKFQLSDGAVLWSQETPYPCTNVAAVSRDGNTVVVAPGAIPMVDGPLFYWRDQIRALPRELKLALKSDIDRRMRDNTLRNFFGMEDLTGAIMGFDAQTGKVLWRHEVPPSGSITAAGDQERNFRSGVLQKNDHTNAENFLSMQDVPHCGPPHWSSPLLDDEGNVYIGDSVGEIRVYNPKADVEVDFHTDDGIMLPGAASAPGMMVFTTCQSVYSFKAKEA